MKPLKRNLILIGIFLAAFLIYQATSTEILDSSPDFESEQIMSFQELNYLDLVEMDTSSYGEMELLNNETLIFAGEQYNSPKMYDVSDPTNINDLGEISSILYPHHMATEGDLLFVSFPHKIEAYNLSDINNPALYKEYATTNYEVSSLEVYNGHLFTIYHYNFQAYLGIYNISTAEHWNWSAPSVEMYFNDLILDNSGLAIIGHNDGIMFLNVTNASSPESVLFYFGKSKPSYEEFGRLYNKANFDEDTPGIVWETLSQEKSHYYLGIRHEKNTLDIEKVSEVLAGYLSKSLYHCLDIIMMIIFPQSTLLVNLQELSSIDFTTEPFKLKKEILTSSIKVQEQLNKAANYHSVFESFMAGIFQDELYAIPKP